MTYGRDELIADALKNEVEVLEYGDGVIFRTPGAKVTDFGQGVFAQTVQGVRRGISHLEAAEILGVAL